MVHGVPMKDGNHSRCVIELLACPAHTAGQRSDQHREALPGTSMFSEALQALLVNAGLLDGDEDHTEPEDK
jgi:hypothetical protein